MEAKDLETVTCSNCSKPSSFPKGTLSEDGKKHYVCPSCTRGTVESKVQAHEHAGKKLLTEDM